MNRMASFIEMTPEQTAGEPVERRIKRGLPKTNPSFKSGKPFGMIDGILGRESDKVFDIIRDSGNVKEACKIIGRRFGIRPEALERWYMAKLTAKG